jgi:hypothetical protein
MVRLFVVVKMRHKRTFNGSRSGSISEYPEASAIIRRLDRVLTRCSIIVSVDG